MPHEVKQGKLLNLHFNEISGTFDFVIFEQLGFLYESKIICFKVNYFWKSIQSLNLMVSPGLNFLSSPESPRLYVCFKRFL
jgi:hypothetical protein